MTTSVLDHARWLEAHPVAEVEAQRLAMRAGLLQVVLTVHDPPVQLDQLSLVELGAADATSQAQRIDATIEREPRKTLGFNTSAEIQPDRCIDRLNPPPKAVTASPF